MSKEMNFRPMKALMRAACAAVFAMLCGCMTPSGTAVYYLPTTAKVFPPKDKDAVIPILGRPPKEPYTTIGKLAFKTDRGWRFVRKSILYNARANGADAVILRDMNSWSEQRLQQVPPTIDWVPMGNYPGCGRPGVTFVPIFQPGYVQQYTVNKILFEAEMIVFKR